MRNSKATKGSCMQEGVWIAVGKKLEFLRVPGGEARDQLCG